jgi:hypothetical protein
MTPNKLPPLPEKAGRATIKVGRAKYRTCDLYTADQMHAYAAEALRQSQSLPAGAVAWLEAEPGTTLAELCSARDFLTMYRSTLVHVGAREPAKRQPDNVLFPLYPALQADAREKGEAWKPIGVAPMGVELVAKLHDGSELHEAIRQSDGDWWWEHKFFDASLVAGWRSLATQSAQASEKDNG